MLLLTSASSSQIYTLSLHDALPISFSVKATSGGRSDGLALEDRSRDSTTPASNRDRKSTRLNSSHQIISYAVFCLKKNTGKGQPPQERRDRRALLRTLAIHLSRAGR